MFITVSPYLKSSARSSRRDAAREVDGGLEPASSDGEQGADTVGR